MQKWMRSVILVTLIGLCCCCAWRPAVGRAILGKPVTLFGDGVEFGSLQALRWNPAAWNETRSVVLCYEANGGGSLEKQGKKEEAQQFQFNPPPAILKVEDANVAFQTNVEFQRVPSVLGDAESDTLRFCALVDPCQIWSEMQYLKEPLAPNATVSVQFFTVDSGIRLKTVSFELSGGFRTRKQILAMSQSVAHFVGGSMGSGLEHCPLDGRRCTFVAETSALDINWKKEVDTEAYVIEYLIVTLTPEASEASLSEKNQSEWVIPHCVPHQDSKTKRGLYPGNAVGRISILRITDPVYRTPIPMHFSPSVDFLGTLTAAQISLVG